MEKQSLIDGSTRDFNACHAEFDWSVPPRFNMAHAICDRHQSLQQQIALYYEH